MNIDQSLFLGTSDEAQEAYRQSLEEAQKVLLEHYAMANQPYRGGSIKDLSDQIDQMEMIPELGQPLSDVLRDVGGRILNHSVVVHHPACVAHLQCPPLLVSLAAEHLIAASNQSMDSWDQSPMATLAEQRMVDSLAQLFGYSQIADGVFTSGGTQSNLMGLLLARDHYAKYWLDWDIRRQGLPKESSSFRIYCSKVAHFTIQQSASLLGLGEEAVIPIPTDAEQRMDVSYLQSQIRQDRRQGFLPIVLIGTAGTTDFGSVDPLFELGNIAGREKLWFHVDAAYGGALAISERYRRRLRGIELADSITTDFHKLFYQPASCGAFLVKDAAHFQLIHAHIPYLNSASDEEWGIPHLVGKSLQTTRRFDALKLLISLQVLGRHGMAQLIETTMELAQSAATLIEKIPCLELINPRPQLNAVVFRYRSSDPAQDDQINDQIRHRLMQQGQVVLAKTTIQERVCLKLTLLNPQTTQQHVERILEQVQEAAASEMQAKEEKIGHV